MLRPRLSATIQADFSSTAAFSNVAAPSFIDELVGEGEWCDFNSPPIALDDSAHAAAGQWIDIYVRNNDSDPDFEPFDIVSVTQPTQGSVQMYPGFVSYTANANATGVDRFEYTIRDMCGNTDTALVTVSLVGITGFSRERRLADGLDARGRQRTVLVARHDPLDAAVFGNIARQPAANLVALLRRHTADV